VRPHDRKQGLNIFFFNTTGLNGENIFQSPIQPRDACSNSTGTAISRVIKSPTGREPERTRARAEVRLVSQGLRSRLQYPGTPNFTHDGKYFYLTSPGYVLRTDGSARFGPFKAERIDLRYLSWPAKWMRDHLPNGRDSPDWMITEYREEGYGLTNVVTGGHRARFLERFEQ